MKKRRLIAIICLIVILPLGFSTKFYKGWAEDWISNSFGGLLYVIFWCLVIFLLMPKLKPKNIAIGVFVVTSVLETLQLWHPPLLEHLRSNFIGVTILGNSFVFSDFIYYILGAAIGLALLTRISKYK